MVAFCGCGLAARGWFRAVAVLAFLLNDHVTVASAQEHSCAASWPRLDAELTIEVQPGPAAVGEPVEIRWSVSRANARGPAAFEVPAYLVVTAPEATRVEGKGFFALTPGAVGPYNMKFGADKTRLVAPLNTRFSANSGQMAILPYQAGELTLEWAIVQADQCGERISDQQGQTTLIVQPGAPRLAAHDSFATKAPDSIIKPNRGPFLARRNGGAFEFHNRETGEIVLQTTGRSAVFSPTGRFVIVETNEAQLSDVFDLVAERRLGRFQSIGMYWSHADSFLYLDLEWGGAMQIVRTLHGRRQAPEEAPVADVLTRVRVQEVQLPDSAVHAGLDQNSEDIDAGEGGGSFVAGKEAWALELSLEGGVVAFLNLFHIGDDPDEQLRGQVIDLGLSHPMIATELRSQLVATLGSDFGILSPSVEGWNVNDKLIHVHDFYREYNDSKTIVSTQSSIAGASIASAASDAKIQLRGGVSLAAAYSKPTSGSRAMADLPFQFGIAPTLLRSGVDNRELEAVTATLATLYDPGVAEFGSAADDYWQGSYGTIPFPRPDRQRNSEQVQTEDAAGEQEIDHPIDLTKEGRDTWQWEIDGMSYWLTQTVESGRLGHAFSFTLLGSDGSELRYADLLNAPSMLARESGDVDVPFGLNQQGDQRLSLGEAFTEPSHVSVVANRYLLLATRPIVRLVVFDLAAWKHVCVVSNPYNESGIDRLALLDDNRGLVQLNKNGSVDIYSCADGKRVLSGIIADGDLVIMDANGYFDGPEEATAYVELKLPGLPGRQLLSQFTKQLHVPGLAQSVLEGHRTNVSPVRLAPPAVAVSPSENGRAWRVSARSSIGLRSLQVLSGGRLARSWDIEGGAADLEVEAEGLSGIVTFIAVDTNGISSAPLEMLVDGELAALQGGILGFAVGIDNYPGMPGSNLRFAAADAHRIAQAVGTSTDYNRTAVEPLINEEAEAEAILSRLDKLVAEAGPEDTIFLSFAGHGLVDRAGQLRLALATTEVDRLEETSLDFEEIAKRLRLAKARAVVLLDVCHAGASARAEVASNDDAVRQLSTDSGAGIVILSASKGAQFSEESAAIAGGRFSVAFQRVLADDRAHADADGNGRISIRELYRGVKTIVADETSGRQIPWLSLNQIYGDFDVF